MSKLNMDTFLGALLAFLVSDGTYGQRSFFETEVPANRRLG